MQRLLARSADSLRGCMGTLKWGGEEGGEGRGGEGVLMLRNIFQLMRTHENKSVWAHYAHA